MIKAFKSDSGEWMLDVLGNPYGGHNNGRDSDSEFFDAATKFHEDKFTSPVAVHYHGYDRSGAPTSTPEYIGRTVKRWVDSQGVWYRVVLDQAVKAAQELWRAAPAGTLRASSGSVAHLVRKVKANKLLNGLGQAVKVITGYRDGHILEWPVVELSIMDMAKGMNPANRYAVVTPASIKAIYDQAGISLPDLTITPEETGAERAANANSATVEGAAKHDIVATHGVKAMNEDQVRAAIEAALKAQRDADALEAQRKADMQAQVEAALKAQKEQHDKEMATIKAEAAANRRLPGGGSEAPYQTQFGNIAKYDDLDPTDAAVLAGILSAAKMANRSVGVSEDLRKYLAIQLAESPDKDRQFVASKSAMKMAGLPMKANELNQSTLASYGDEWIGVTYSTQLWDKIRLAAPIAARIPTVTIPQGSESIIIPLASTSPTFYKVAQASAQDANPGRVTPTATTSRMGTDKKTLSVSKLGAAVNYTGELEEDSLIPWVTELRSDLTKEAAEVLEHIILDGDTATGGTTNINDIAGTPAGNEAFLLFDGFRKLALVTNTANARSAGTLAIEDYLETVKLLGLAGKNAADKAAVNFIVDMWTHWKSLELAEVKTRDVFVAPTVENGMLTNVYGYNVITTPNMHRANQDATYGLKANTAGKVDLDTAANNTTGAILAVRWDQWRLGYKRRMTFEVEREAISDSTNIVVMMRVGMINRDNEAASISYNVTL